MYCEIGGPTQLSREELCREMMDRLTQVPLSQYEAWVSRGQPGAVQGRTRSIAGGDGPRSHGLGKQLASPRFRLPLQTTSRNESCARSQRLAEAIRWKVRYWTQGAAATQMMHWFDAQLWITLPYGFRWSLLVLTFGLGFRGYHVSNAKIQNPRVRRLSLFRRLPVV
jgi:hypothetical protein